MVTDLDKVVLPPTPKTAATLPEYQRNIENWTREVEQTFRKFEMTVRALVAALNQLEK